MEAIKARDKAEFGACFVGRVRLLSVKQTFAVSFLTLCFSLFKFNCVEKLEPLSFLPIALRVLVRLPLRNSVCSAANGAVFETNFLVQVLGSTSWFSFLIYVFGSGSWFSLLVTTFHVSLKTVLHLEKPLFIIHKSL